MILRLLGIVLVIVVAIPAVFITQLYNPPILWIASFILLFSSPLISLIKKRSYKIIFCVIFSFIINMNYIFNIPYGNPIYEMALYGMGLLAFIFTCLISIVHIADGLKKTEFFH